MYFSYYADGWCLIVFCCAYSNVNLFLYLPGYFIGSGLTSVVPVKQPCGNMGKSITWMPYQRQCNTNNITEPYIHFMRKSHNFIQWYAIPCSPLQWCHYCDAIMGTVASQITSLTIVYAAVYSYADQSKHQSSASLAFVWGIHRRPMNSPHKWPVTRKMVPFDDVIMSHGQHGESKHCQPHCFQGSFQFLYAPSQWETTLQCNVVSHWLGAYTKWSLCFFNKRG